jgi:hypothetical protein
MKVARLQAIFLPGNPVRTQTEIVRYRTYAHPPQKKLERVFRLGQIVRDGRFDNFPLCMIDSDGIDTVNDLKTDESADRTVDVITLAGFFSDLTILDATEFFESAMIVFNRPADSLEISSVLVIHGEEICSPEPHFPILVDGMKDPDEPEFFHMDVQSVIRDTKGGNRVVVGMIRVDHSVLLDA